MANTFLNKDGLSHLVSKLKDYITSQISAHTSNKSNPHGVTKSQVGLGSVANIDQSKAIKSISRSGTTFTATALDGTKTTFDQQDSNTTYGTMKGASTSAAGSSGLVPAPATGAANRYLRSDGTWAVPPDTDTTYSDATTSAHGLMSASDKSKLNGIASGATKNASTVKYFTLSASGWSSGSYTISDSLITTTSNQEILPAVGITAAQFNALCKAQIVDGGQAAGSMTLKALGTTPTIDIPIRVIFRGTI